jgi:hypothetical protein
MKTKLNIALEGTCSGDVVGGLLSWTGEPFRRFCFERGLSSFVLGNKKTLGERQVPRACARAVASLMILNDK